MDSSMIMKRTLKIIAVIMLAIVILIAGMLIFMTAAEYKPADVEKLPVGGKAENRYYPGSRLSILSWNVGYGALGDNADFFMDGGKMVMSADRDRIQKNLEGIMAAIEDVGPDIILLQETDHNSSRSYHMDECRIFRDRFAGYESSYGANHKAAFVPYPVPPIGKVDAGLLTLTGCHVESASRIQLPVPFKWPVRLVNLKRCVTKTRIPLYEPSEEGDDASKTSDQELVLFNLHLEAFDDGEGKTAQTKMLAGLLQEEREKGNYVIAGGDFNQFFTPEDKEAYPDLAGKWYPGELDTEQFGKGWSFLTGKGIPSCRSLDRPYEGADHDSFQYYVIDGFIVSDNIQVHETKTLDQGFVCSDHNPVLLTFTIGKKEQ